MKKTQIKDFFIDYKNALFVDNIADISKYFHLPCLISMPSLPVVAINSEEELKQATTSGLRGDYKKEIKNVDLSLIIQSKYDGGNSVANVTFEIFGEENRPLGMIRWLYHLVQTQNQMKILTATHINHNSIEY